MGRSRLSNASVELDLGRYELRRDGRRIRLEKKPMELLILGKGTGSSGLCASLTPTMDGHLTEI